MLKKIVKKILALLFSDYEIYKIFTQKNTELLNQDKSKQFDFVEITPSIVNQFNSELMQSNAGYLGENANGFACIYDNEIVGVCFFWHGKRYLKRNFWPLKPDEAKLVHIETLTKMKGIGVAPSLINFASEKMYDNKFQKLYARIWHSNTPSIKCFEKSGWHYLRTVITFTLPFAIKVKFKLPS